MDWNWIMRYRLQIGAGACLGLLALWYWVSYLPRREERAALEERQQTLDEEITRLHAACREVLEEWTERTRREVGAGFPEKVTAFRKGMAVHGRYGEPCPVCGAPVQRIVYAENETNYCARCQTEGKLLADRALSRLLHDDWPRTLEELEELKAAR